MMEVWLVGWGDGCQGWVDAAPPRRQASCRRAESRRRLRLCRGAASLRTPGARRLEVWLGAWREGWEATTRRMVRSDDWR